MAAGRAVFSTTELLEAILLQLPGQEISRMQLVSKRWASVLVSSAAIRRHFQNRVLVPSHSLGDYSIPVYVGPPNLELNPILVQLGAQRRYLGPCEPTLFIMKYEVDRKTMQKQEIIDSSTEMVTKLPCRQICVRDYGPPGHGEVIIVESGVKISDLISLGERLDDMRKQLGDDFGYPNQHLRCRYRFELLWFEDTTIPQWVTELREGEIEATSDRAEA